MKQPVEEISRDDLLALIGERPRMALVCGASKESHLALIQTTLPALWREIGWQSLVHGAARNVDTEAGDVWDAMPGREEAGCPVALKEPADWRRHGRGAGPIRNRMMFKKHEPDFILAYPGGNGTADMCDIAIKAGVPVVQVQRDATLRFLVQPPAPQPEPAPQASFGF